MDRVDVGDLKIRYGIGDVVRNVEGAVENVDVAFGCRCTGVPFDSNFAIGRGVDEIDFSKFEVFKSGINTERIKVALAQGDLSVG